MAEYRIKWNKYEKIQVSAEEISAFCIPAFIYPVSLPRQITNYQSPPEEKELLLDEIPQPDFGEILNNPDTEKQT